MKRRTKLGILGLLAGAGIGGGLAALGSSLYKAAMVPTPREAGGDENDPPLYREGRAWAERGEGFESAEVLSADGLKLWAAYVPAGKRNHHWAICVHGFHDDHTSMGAFGKRYHEKGFHVLMPDQRGFGRSEGTYIGWGWEERQDLAEWIAWVLSRDSKAEIVLHGVSMGAATVLMATGDVLPQNVKAAVSDCSYSDIESEMRHVAVLQSPGKRLPGFASRAAFNALRRTARHRAGFDLRSAAPVRAVERSTTPTLFIHGRQDDFVPAGMMRQLYQAAACPKSFLWVPGAGHAVSVGIAPELYWDTVDTFLESLGMK